MTPRFTQKVMVITGAAQGIGKRVAELAAAEGARLLLVDIADYVQNVAAELRDRAPTPLRFRLTLKPGPVRKPLWLRPTGSLAVSTF